MVEQVEPDARHERDPDGERLAEIVRHLDVGASVRPVRLLQAERRVIAGRADPQHAGGANSLQCR
jgi:hypothetical protein